MMNDLPRNVAEFAFNQSNDSEWHAFVVPILNIASFDMPIGMRIGQRIMNALGERNPEMFATITNTEFDVWECDDKNDPKFGIFFDRIFELFVESL